MNELLKRIKNSKLCGTHVVGLSGKTHVAMSLSIFLALSFIQDPLFTQFFGNSYLLNSIPFILVSCILVMGFALLPDLDGNGSAKYRLGFFGSLCQIFMQTTSSIVWNICRTKRDKPPISQHRYLWHALIASISVYLLYYFIDFGDNNTKSIIEILQQNMGVDTLFSSALLIIGITVLFMAGLVGSGSFLSLLPKMFKRSIPSAFSYILPLGICIYLLFISIDELRAMGTASSLGYLFHTLGDGMADSGIPFLAPLPVFGRCWKRIRLLPKTITTGGIVDTILCIVLFIVAIFLFGFKMYVVIRGL